MDSVWVLEHSDGEDPDGLLGIYHSAEEAKAAYDRSMVSSDPLYKSKWEDHQTNGKYWTNGLHITVAEYPVQ